MNDNNSPEKIENDNVLGPGLEPLAVCLMILFIWMFVVTFASKFFM